MFSPRSARRRPRGRRAIAATLVAAAALLGTPAAAHADDSGGVALFGGTDIGIGTSSDGYGIVGPDAVSSLLDSSYSLADLDPASGSMSSADVTSSLSDDYALSADLADSSFLAIDTARLAADAQQQAEAKRRALAAAGKGLKPGSVPAPYDTLILDAVATRCPDLSPAILAAQLNQESGFNPRAQSGVGAQGIAQFMPGTWATYGVDGNGDGRKDVWDPADAIPAAAGYDCALLRQVRNVPGDPTANMLAAYNAGPGAVLQYNGVPPYGQTQNYVSTIIASASRFSAGPDGAQTEVGPDGCPTSAPGNTLRQGSSSVGVEKLCADSVAQARTPQAAMAIKFALANLGVPYSQPQRNSPGFFDCSSFVSRAYRSAGLNLYSGNAPTTDTLRAAPWMVSIPFAQARPGDLVEPEPGHVAMVLADGFKVHTNQTGDVSKVEQDYTSAYWTGWLDPSRV